MTLPLLDELTDTSEWRNVPIWTIDEAALLWGAIDPLDISPSTVHEAKLASERGELHRSQWKKSALAQRAFTEAVCAGDVSIVDAWEIHEDYHNGPYEIQVKPGVLPNINHILTAKTRVRQAALVQWAKQTGMLAMRTEIKRRQVFLSAQTVPTIPTPSPVSVKQVPIALPGYTTPAIDLMTVHIEQHWQDFDPKNPETAISKRETLEWLREQAKYRGITQNEADAIDLITRHPTAKKGRHK